MNDKEFQKIWNNPINLIGRITLSSAVAASFFPAMYLMISHGIFPPLDVVLKAWILVVSSYGVIYIIEPISYYPVLGLSGTYMTFLSGNGGNMRVPAAVCALDVTETQPGTRSVEIISALGIAGSIITNLFFVTLAAVLGAAILNAVPPIVSDAFKSYAVPAIFGAVLMQFGIKYPILLIFGLVVPLACKFFIPNMPSFAIMLAGLIITIISSKFIYGKNN